jgi:hypothetical protein
LGAQPVVTVRGFVIAVCPAAPELAAIVTVVVCETDFAACIVAAPPPVVHPPWMNGWPFAMTDATAVLPLETLIGTPLAGATFASSTSMIETPPGAIVDGLKVNEAIAGVGGSVPPGLSVRICATGTSCFDTP